MEKRAISLPNGALMPCLGFGTWQAADEELETALNVALEAGYRHIDTATVYENEKVIGKVLKKWLDSGKINRSELFIVTKLPPSGHNPGGVQKWLERSLKDLQLSYVDLYLIHTPFAFVDVEGDLHPVDENGEMRIDMKNDLVKVWREMEVQVEEKRAKAIGVSNFNVKQIKKILENARIPISNLQIEFHVYLQQKELVRFCKDNKITVTAYSPLGSRGLVKMLKKTETLPDLLENPAVLEISKKYEKTPAQILLSYIVQMGIAAIPKSTNPRRIKENIDLFDWQLQTDDMETLAKLDSGENGRICDFSFFKGIRRHPEFPF